MTLTQAFGAVLVAAPIIGAIAYLAAHEGWRVALFVWGGTLLTIAMVITGAHLLVGGQL